MIWTGNALMKTATSFSFNDRSCPKAFRCSGWTLRIRLFWTAVIYHNPQTRQDEPAAEVFLQGKSEPLCWISREHVSAVTRELTGILVSNGKYSLTAICTLPN